MGGRWQQNDEICRSPLQKSGDFSFFLNGFHCKKNGVLVFEKHRFSSGKILFSTAENIVF